ncbi:hypothetical protein QUB63_32670 [Microcoleus sp. ARI1-B5]|uniref:hypothetical protein n=1 Tax=unclassified Microcoleus TaxID=2642155 RepID=UPI002FD3A063
MSNFHDLINNNFHHPDYGKLLHHRDIHQPNILHYSVQLNDCESIAWEPIHSNRQRDTGRLAIWQIDWHRFQTAKWISYRQKERINKALHISVAEFHECWQYELYRFNCEHWARLVTTGNCCCHQITEFKKSQKIPVLGVLVVGIVGCVTGAWEHNGYAQKLIAESD